MTGVAPLDVRFLIPGFGPVGVTDRKIIDESVEGTLSRIGLADLDWLRALKYKAVLS